MTIDQLGDLIDQTSAARGVDIYAVEIVGLSASEWAEQTGRSPSTVARNVRRARDQIDEIEYL
jgi:DNA-directed RNA polymerase specialized sigma24 family protein